MEHKVTVYNWDLTPERKNRYEDIMKQIAESYCSPIWFHVDHDNRSITFWSYSSKAWTSFLTKLNEKY